MHAYWVRRAMSQAEGVLPPRPALIGAGNTFSHLYRGLRYGRLNASHRRIGSKPAGFWVSGNCGLLSLRAGERGGYHLRFGSNSKEPQ